MINREKEEGMERKARLEENKEDVDLRLRCEVGE